MYMHSFMNRKWISRLQTERGKISTYVFLNKAFFQNSVYFYCVRTIIHIINSNYRLLIFQRWYLQYYFPISIVTKIKKMNQFPVSNDEISIFCCWAFLWWADWHHQLTQFIDHFVNGSYKGCTEVMLTAVACVISHIPNPGGAWISVRGGGNMNHIFMRRLEI